MIVLATTTISTKDEENIVARNTMKDSSQTPKCDMRVDMEEETLEERVVSMKKLKILAFFYCGKLAHIGTVGKSLVMLMTMTTCSL